MQLSELTVFCIINHETGELYRGLRGNRLFPSKGAAVNSFNQKRRRQRANARYQEQDQWVVREVTCSPTSE